MQQTILFLALLSYLAVDAQRIVVRNGSRRRECLLEIGSQPLDERYFHFSHHLPRQGKRLDDRRSTESKLAANPCLNSMCQLPDLASPLSLDLASPNQAALNSISTTPVLTSRAVSTYSRFFAGFQTINRPPQLGRRLATLRRQGPCQSERLWRRRSRHEAQARCSTVSRGHQIYG